MSWNGAPTKMGLAECLKMCSVGERVTRVKIVMRKYHVSNKLRCVNYELYAAMHVYSPSHELG